MAVLRRLFKPVIDKDREGALPSRRNCIASGLNERLRFERVPKQGARDSQGAVAMRFSFIRDHRESFPGLRRVRGVPPKRGFFGG